MPLQLALDFPKVEEYNLENFIPHSGVIEAFKSLQKLRSDIERKELKGGKLVLVFGPQGVGKTHLLRCLFDNLNKSQFNIDFIDFDAGDEIFRKDSREIKTEKFIDLYQSLKIKSGVLFVSTRGPLLRSEIDPHIYSRLMSGDILELTYPAEEELLPVLKSIFERYGLRLNEKDLNRIINQVPAVPECFKAVCEELDRMLLQGEKFKPSLLKTVLLKEEIRI